METWASVTLERLADCRTSLRIPHSNRLVIRSRDDVAPIGRVSNGPHRASVPLKRLADCQPSLASHIRIVLSSDPEMMCAHWESKQRTTPSVCPSRGCRLQNQSLHPIFELSCLRSGDDVAPIGRVSNRPHPSVCPLRGLPTAPSLGIPYSNCIVFRSGDDVAPIGRVSNGPHHPVCPSRGLPTGRSSLRIPHSNCVSSDPEMMWRPSGE
jgi:hypothetical protein